MRKHLTYATLFTLRPSLLLNFLHIYLNKTASSWGAEDLYYTVVVLTHAYPQNC